ncbi:helix-turn-helix domain-containing protein [Acuticoccus sediminis]|uniref:helix-turn-helix domain-containing protein n=1 Tax=Acuticoccus sediminis TaxID=2184697 RepID=UPI001CFF1189|nr:helix-turn-helix transcriptional regulator [Acuticoccus sediminis]
MSRRRQSARRKALLFRRNYIFERRRMLGLTLQMLAERAEVDEDRLFELEEHYDPRVFDIASLARIADVLECPYLLLWVPPKGLREGGLTWH